MKTWDSIARRIERNRLPYKVERYNLSQRGTLITLDGKPVAYTVQGARDVLSAPGHPDGKRQARRKARDLARYGSRCFKTSEVFFTSFLEREENHLRARFLASKLTGKWFMCPDHGNKRFSWCPYCLETIDPPAPPTSVFHQLLTEMVDAQREITGSRHHAL